MSPSVNICSDAFDILEALEGPDIEPEDLFWLAELPSGLDLLHFLVAQGAREPGCNSRESVYLEREENQILQRALRLGLAQEATFTPRTANEIVHSGGTPSYVLPSSLRLNLTRQQEELTLLYHESTRLESRKAAVNHSIKKNLKIRNAFALSQQELEGSLRSMSHELMNLQVESDASITSASHSASRLIHEQACLDLEIKNSSTVNDILDIVASIRKDVIRLMSSGSWALKGPSRNSVTQLQDEMRYLMTSVSRLERYVTNGEAVADKHFTNLKDIWNLERSISLKERLQKTHKVIQILEDHLIPLSALSNASLSACNRLTEDTLIVCQALLDEIDTIETMNSDFGSISKLPDSIMDEIMLSNLFNSGGDETESLLHVHQGHSEALKKVKPAIENTSKSLINLKNQNLEVKAQFPNDLSSQDVLSISPALNKEVLTAQQHVKTLSRLVNEIPSEVEILDIAELRIGDEHQLERSIGDNCTIITSFKFFKKLNSHAATGISTPHSMWHDTTSSKDIRKLIRKESNNTYNRLHSISEDADFVTQVAHFYPDFKVYPNLRCGAWYVNPAIAEPSPVYFKSTDGHFGQWAFNLRRLNLHLLQSIVDFGGIVIVDSTRQGKRLPDALSKTIPIWCAVINLAMLKLSHDSQLIETLTEWALHTPPGSVSKSEHSQIQQRLEHWAQVLLDSEFTLPSLSKPLRPIWVTPDTEVLPSLSRFTEFHPVVCLSASKLLSEGLERRVAGYTYVQGSGDDHETWSSGLTPRIYWAHKEQLLACPPEELMDLIYDLVNLDKDPGFDRMLFPVKAANSRISVGALPGPFDMNEADHVLITCLSNVENLDSDKLLYLKLLPNKKGQLQFLTELLPQAMTYLKDCLDRGEDVVILCHDGKDLSIGIALAALTLYFNIDGSFVQQGQSNEGATKQTIKKRLQWILADDPYANPSRNTLKRVNEYLMSQPRRLHAVAAAVK